MQQVGFNNAGEVEYIKHDLPVGQDELWYCYYLLHELIKACGTYSKYYRRACRLKAEHPGAIIDDSPRGNLVETLAELQLSLSQADLPSFTDQEGADILDGLIAVSDRRRYYLKYLNRTTLRSVRSCQPLPDLSPVELEARYQKCLARRQRRNTPD